MAWKHTLGPKPRKTLKSKKALFTWIQEKFNQTLTLDSENVDNETFGRDSRIYLWNVSKQFGISRQQLEAELIQAGFKVHRDYWPGGDCVELSVSYFKGWHWDE